MVRDVIEYVPPGLLVDGELELVPPEERWVEAVLAACRHPLTMRDMPAQGRTTRDQLVQVVRACARGFVAGDPWGEIVPSYTFWMHLRDDAARAFGVSMAGSVTLRLGFTRNLDLYLGHIGYHVYPPARGHHYAERACRLLLPLARQHGFDTLWITTNPDNAPSRRTCERLGGMLVETVAVPADNALYGQGDREKCRYRVETTG